MNEKDPFNQLGEGFKPELPQVTNETVQGVIGDFKENPNFIMDTFARLIGEQAALSNLISSCVNDLGRDQDEQRAMIQMFVLTYRAIESQAQADALAGSFNLQPDA